MLTINFSEQDIQDLHYERFHYPHPAIQVRMEVLYLKSQGFQQKYISELCCIDKRTVKKYLDMYREGGIDALKRWKFKGKKNELMEYRSVLEEYFQAHPPKSIAEAQSVIEEKTGIHRSPTQIGKFLKEIGMKIRKVGFVPGKATDPEHQEKQEKFLKDELEPRLEEAKNMERTLFLSMLPILFMGHSLVMSGVFAVCLFLPYRILNTSMS